jgi:hypothetical protein
MLPLGSSEGVSGVTASGFAVLDFAIVFLINFAGRGVLKTHLSNKCNSGRSALQVYMGKYGHRNEKINTNPDSAGQNTDLTHDGQNYLFAGSCAGG